MQMSGEARETASPRPSPSGHSVKWVKIVCLGLQKPHGGCAWSAMGALQLVTYEQICVCMLHVLYSLHATWLWLKITFKTRQAFPTLDFTSLCRCTLRVCSASENSYDLTQKYSKWKSRQRLYVRREVGSMWTINMWFPVNNVMRFSSTINRLYNSQWV